MASDSQKTPLIDQDKALLPETPGLSPPKRDKAYILIVEDSPRNIQVLGSTLAVKGYEIFIARNGLQALEKVEDIKPDLILLDVLMPELDGFETCRRLKASPTTAEIPVIFLTAKTELDDIVKGFQLGAVDYVTKPFKKEELLKCKGVSRSLSLDIFDQWVGLEQNGQFRYTPPIQVIMAFKQALVEFEEEGGVEGRSARYITNHKILLDGMRRLGFKEYIPDNLKSHIITSFLFPEDESFSFDDFYNRLSEKGFVIYPGKLSKVNCFRIGNIGRIFQNDMLDLLAAVEETIIELQIKL